MYLPKFHQVWSSAEVLFCNSWKYIRHATHSMLYCLVCGSLIKNIPYVTYHILSHAASGLYLTLWVLRTSSHNHVFVPWCLHEFGQSVRTSLHENVASIYSMRLNLSSLSFLFLHSVVDHGLGEQRESHLPHLVQPTTLLINPCCCYSRVILGGGFYGALSGWK